MNRADSSYGPQNVIERALESTPIRYTLWLWMVMVPLSAFFTAPRNGGFTPDWQFFEFFDEVARKTIADFHQLPIWNPYYCGGITMIGNPQTTFLTPTFLLILHFGTTFGERLSNIPVLIVGCEGCYRLMRHLNVRRSAAVLAAVAFPFYGRTAGWLHDGQHGLPGWALSGWVLYGFLRGLDRPIYLALGGVFFAWQVCYRGIETAPELALGICIWALLEARLRFIERRSWREIIKPIGAGTALGLFGLGFAGIRMVPVLELVLTHPRIVVEHSVRSISAAFVHIYALPPGTAGYEASGYAYVGIITFMLFVGAVFFARARRRTAIPLLCALFFMLLTLGMHGPFSPLPHLHELPLFKSLRNPYLWGFAGALFVVIAATLALDELASWLEDRGPRCRILTVILVPVLVLGVAADLLARTHHTIGGRNSPFTWTAPTRVPDEFRQSRGNRFMQATFPYFDRGTLSCYDETPFPTSPALRPDLPMEEYLTDPDAGTIRRVKWTPNAIELEAILKRPSTVVVNQNWQPGWSASLGTVRSKNGLLAVDLPVGTSHFTVRMWPISCTIGLGMMIVALGVTALLWRSDRMRRARSLAF
jgi:hypothetical protein